jgi:hypothetical protein
MTVIRNTKLVDGKIVDTSLPKTKNQQYHEMLAERDRELARMFKKPESPAEPTAEEKRLALVKEIREKANRHSQTPGANEITMADMAKGDNYVRAKMKGQAELQRIEEATKIQQRLEDSAIEFRDYLPRTSNAEIFSIPNPSGNYLLAYDSERGGRAFIKRQTDLRWYVLVKSADQPFGCNPAVTQQLSNPGIQDLTVAEFNAIKTNRISLDSVFSAYMLCEQRNMTFTNEGKSPTVVW